MDTPVRKKDQTSLAERNEAEDYVTMSRLTSLPLELQLMIVQQLLYPDSLAMKLTCRYFHDLITPSHTVAKRVTWLLERASITLHIPTMGELKLNNDDLFLQSPEVQAILRRRRTHQECVDVWDKEIRTSPRDHRDPSRGCLVQMSGDRCGAIEEAMARTSDKRKAYACRDRRRWYQLNLPRFGSIYFIHCLIAITVASVMTLGYVTKQSPHSDIGYGITIADKIFTVCCVLGAIVWRQMLPRLILWERRVRSRWRSQNTWLLIDVPSS